MRPTCRRSRSGSRPRAAARRGRRRHAPGETVAVASANARLRAGRHGAAGVDPAGLRWAAVGHATAVVLRAVGIAGIFVPTAPDAQTLAAELPVDPGGRVLVPHGDIADPGLTIALRARGADVREVVAYSTAEAPAASGPRLVATLDEGPVDVLVLTSRSTVHGLLALADEGTRPGILATPVVAAGSQTAAAARDAGFRLVLVAPAPDALALAAFTAHALGVPPAANHAAGDELDELDPAPTTGGAR